MISSMTGYAVVSRDIGRAVLQIELRSINSRYLDLSFRIVEELRFAEPLLRELINASVSRGKLECRLSLQASNSARSDLVINDVMLNQLLTAQECIKLRAPDATVLSIGEMLRWPGVLSEDGVNNDQLNAQLQEVCREALAELKATRQREGAKLAIMLRDNLAQMREKVLQATPLLPIAVAEYRERLTAKLREAVATLDDDRIRQEVTVFAQRIDVAEELTRLNAHIDEVERVISKGGATGKRLDFLMQELNREGNTLASKAANAELTGISVDIKVLIEQMREQVQNLE